MCGGSISRSLEVELLRSFTSILRADKFGDMGAIGVCMDRKGARTSTSPSPSRSQCKIDGYASQLRLAPSGRG